MCDGILMDAQAFALTVALELFVMNHRNTYSISTIYCEP